MHIYVTAQFTTADRIPSRSGRKCELTFPPELKKDLLAELYAMLDSHEVSKVRDLNVSSWEDY